MAPSFDSAVSSLLCLEDNSFFDDNDYGAAEECEATWRHRNNRNHNQDRGFVDRDGLPLQSDEYLASMLEKECQHLPAADYLKRLRSGDLDLGARRRTVDWIFKQSKPWTVQLLAVACLSLAAKVEETDVPLALDLQMGEAKFVFEARTIQRMELLVLSTLRWRMQAVTPFSFIDYFLCKINGDQTQLQTSISRSIELILSTIKGIDFVEFRPSEVAAAVAIALAEETQTIDNEAATSLLSQHVEKEKVLECVKMIRDFSLIDGSVKETTTSILSVPHSPSGVLDAARLSYKSDEVAVGSCANSSHNSPDAKRRKLNRTFEVEL